jgi:hypothetical protein
VVGSSPRSGESEAPPRSGSSLSSEVEVESEPRVGRGGDRCLGPRLSPSPGSGEAEFVVFRGRARVRALGSGEAEFVVFRGRARVRALGSGEAEFPMAPEAGLGCCQPHSVEWHSSRSDAGGAVFLSGRSVERRSDCGHFRLCRLKSVWQDKMSCHPCIKCSCDSVGWCGDLAKVASWRRLGLGRAEGVYAA